MTQYTLILIITMDRLDVDKILKEIKAKKQKEKYENDLTLKIDNMIKERADNKKYMCFRAQCDNYIHDKEGKLLLAEYRHELIFARKNNFEGMIELHKYRDNFKSASSITFESKIPNSRVCPEPKK